MRRRWTRARTSTRPHERARTPAAGAAKGRPTAHRPRRDADHAPAPASCRRASLPPRPALRSSSSSSRSGCQAVRTLAVWLGWVGFGRGRGPPCQGQLAAVGRPAPATSAAYYAAARLGERETNRCLGSGPRELLLLHVVVSSASSSRASKGTAPPSLLWPRSLPCFASPPPVRRNAAATEKEKKKRACCFRVYDAACRGCGVGSTRSFSSGGGGSSSLA